MNNTAKVKTLFIWWTEFLNIATVIFQKKYLNHYQGRRKGDQQSSFSLLFAADTKVTSIFCKSGG